jgi:hypothetical protein
MMTKLPDTEDPRVVFEQLVKPDALLGQQESRTKIPITSHGGGVTEEAKRVR